MTKYVEVTMVDKFTPDKDNIEVGKKYELVEKEEAPTLKANVTVDVKEVIQAKVDELRNEAEHLFNKRDRLEQHGINLNKKAQKLKEVIETIKEFE